MDRQRLCRLIRLTETTMDVSQAKKYIALMQKIGEMAHKTSKLLKEAEFVAEDFRGMYGTNVGPNASPKTMATKVLVDEVARLRLALDALGSLTKAYDAAKKFRDNAW